MVTAYGSTSEQTKQLILALEATLAEAAMTAKMKLPPDEPKDTPKRRPIPDHIPRKNMELLPPKDHCTCGGALRQIGEDVTEELEHVPGRFTWLAPHYTIRPDCPGADLCCCFASENPAHSNRRPEYQHLDWSR